MQSSADVVLLSDVGCKNRELSVLGSLKDL